MFCACNIFVGAAVESFILFGFILTLSYKVSLFVQSLPNSSTMHVISIIGL